MSEYWRFLYKVISPQHEAENRVCYDIGIST